MAAAVTISVIATVVGAIATAIVAIVSAAMVATAAVVTAAMAFVTALAATFAAALALAATFAAALALTAATLAAGPFGQHLKGCRSVVAGRTGLQDLLERVRRGCGFGQGCGTPRDMDDNAGHAKNR
ncbi:MAG: hypothetical protein HY245_02475 [Rhizobiales bacterium]|nr:hypothetical protein [Hyphomicrobiales bacterium]MBI3672293.1 hypothetical protein [Hyphomicrobiales bacterium]